jgi:hypothetical protein
MYLPFASSSVSFPAVSRALSITCAGKDANFASSSPRGEIFGRRRTYHSALLHVLPPRLCTQTWSQVRESLLRDLSPALQLHRQSGPYLGLEMETTIS